MQIKNTLTTHIVTINVISVVCCFTLVEVSAQAPNRETIAFSTNHEANGGIWLIDIDVRGGQGKGDVHVQNQRVLLAIDGNPIPMGLVWSPDGRRIAFHTEIDENIDVYVVDGDGQNLRQLTDHEAEDSWPSWHPGDEKIAFCTNRDGNFEIYVMSSTGQGLINLTNDSAKDREPDWSPNGRLIALTSKRGKSLGDIWVMDSSGGNLQNLTDVRGEDMQPRWSWDGEKIAWTSRRNGNDEIMTMDAADGGNLLKISDLKDARSQGRPNREPSWKPDGRAIAAPALGGGKSFIMIHPTDGSLQWQDLPAVGIQNRSPAWFDPEFIIEEFSVSPAEKQALTWGWIKQMVRSN